MLNKIDRLSDPDRARDTLEDFPNSTAISALKGSGIDDLLRLIGEQLYEMYTPLTVFLPYKEGGLISIFHEHGQIETSEHVHGGVTIKGRLPGRLLARFKPFTRLGARPSPGESSGEEEIEPDELDERLDEPLDDMDEEPFWDEG